MPDGEAIKNNTYNHPRNVLFGTKDPKSDSSVPERDETSSYNLVKDRYPARGSAARLPGNGRHHGTNVKSGLLS